jgi:membrane protease YdiL (CAAX protease family)
MMIDKRMASRFALIALAVVLADKVAASILIYWLSGTGAAMDVALALHAVVFAWIFPLAITYRVEGRDHRALGLVVRRRNRLRYLLYATLGLVIPAFLLGPSKALLLGLLEQVAFIGGAEELFWRGYLQERLGAWLGKYRGWIVASLLFGAGHLVTLWSHPGATLEMRDLWILIQTTAGGLIFGAIYLRARSIVPGAIVHIAGNLYLSQILELVVAPAAP